MKLCFCQARTSTALGGTTPKAAGARASSPGRRSQAPRTDHARRERASAGVESNAEDAPTGDHPDGPAVAAAAGYAGAADWIVLRARCRR